MERIGLIAGNGRFPFLVAEEIRKKGDAVYVVAFNEETDPGLAACVDKITWMPLGQLQKLIDAFHRDGVKTVIMAGRVKHSYLFAGLALDWRAIKLLGRLMNKKADTILGAVAAELAKEGLTLLPSHLHLNHLLPQKGLLFGPRVSRKEELDVAFGYKMAKQLGGMDIGQSVVVKDLSVVAVEAMEGTDECIKRAGLLAEGAVVVKVAKPNQDWRFDVPVIGPATIAAMAESGMRALAIEAGATLMIDKNEMMKEAKSREISILAV